MKTLYILVVILVSLEEILSKHGQTIDEKIYGQGYIRKTRVKFHVAIKQLTEKCTYRFICSGVLVKPRRVISAAHCFYPNGTLVQTATTCFKAFGSTQEILKGVEEPNDILDVTPHENFKNIKEDGYQNDIAVAILDKAFPGTREISISEAPAGPGMRCIVIGWGTIADNKRIVIDELTEATVTTIDLAKCTNNFYTNLTKKVGAKMICAGDIKQDGKGVCQGDVGSPLVCDDKLVGILSYNDNCTTSKVYPAVYTDVTQLKTFVNPERPSSRSEKMSNAFYLVFAIQILMFVLVK